MTRFKQLALSASAALALLAFTGTASASTAGFEAESYPASLVGVPTSNSLLSGSFGNSSCEGGYLEGSVSEPTSSFSANVSGLVCSLFGPAPVAMNGCEFVFHPGTGEQFAGTFDIGPAECGPITVKGSFLEIKIYPKTGLSVTKYENVGEGSGGAINFAAQISGLKYTYTGSKTVHENGGYVANWQVKGYGQEGNQLGVQTVSQLPAGLHLEGVGGEEENAPRFDAENFPASVSGVQTGNQTIKTPLGNIVCETLATSGEMGSATSDLSVAPTYGKCKAFGFSASVKMNSCHYVLHVADSGPPYSGTVELACEEEGDGIEIVPPLCTVKLPAQTIGSASYETVGEGFARSVSLNISGESVKWTTASCGSGESGTYSGGLSLEASY